MGIDVDRESPAEDVRRLGALGYPQELRRQLTGRTNLVLTFAVISVVPACMAAYRATMHNGGPAAVTIGFLVVGVLTVIVAAALAEISSVLPTAGGLYWWAYTLAPRHKTFWAWATGWCNTLGMIALLAGVDYGAARALGAALSYGYGVTLGLPGTYALFLLILGLHVACNIAGLNLLRVVSSVGLWWQVGTVLAIVALLALAPSPRRPWSVVFTEVHNNTGIVGIIGAGFALLIGLQAVQDTLTGCDTAAHLSEETRRPSRDVPRAMVGATVLSVALGIPLMFALTVSVQDYDRVMNTPTLFPPGQILVDALGSGVGVALLLVVFGAQILCGGAALTTASRVVFAFSRDAGLPGAVFWRQVNRRGVPVKAVLCCAVLAALVTAPGLWYSEVIPAVIGVSVTGLALAYLIPVLLRRRSREFQPGLWHLGRYSAVLGWTAVVWLSLVAAVSLVPTSYPFVSGGFFDYSGAVSVVVIGGALLWYWLDARRWFSGPQWVRRRDAAGAAAHPGADDKTSDSGARDREPGSG